MSKIKDDMFIELCKKALPPMFGVITQEVMLNDIINMDFPEQDSDVNNIGIDVCVNMTYLGGKPSPAEFSELFKDLGYNVKEIDELYNSTLYCVNKDPEDDSCTIEWTKDMLLRYVSNQMKKQYNMDYKLIDILHAIDGKLIFTTTTLNDE